MRNRNGRRYDAQTSHGPAARAPSPSIACCLGAASILTCVANAVLADQPSRWKVRALASDSACVVLDDGRTLRTLCADASAPSAGLRLLRVEPNVAVFEVDVGLSVLLVVRVERGHWIDIRQLGERMRLGAAPRPGWLDTESTKSVREHDGPQP